MQIRTSEQQTIHLVVRDLGDHQPTPSNEPAQRPDASARNPPPQPPQRAAPAAAGPLPWPAGGPILGLAPFPQLVGLPAHVQQQLAHQQAVLHHQQALHNQHLMQLQQRQMLSQQNQRPAAQQASQDGANNAQGGGQTTDSTGGRNSPVGQSFRTVTREGVGPDGQRYSIRFTVNETITPSAPNPRPVAPPPTSDPVGQRPLSAAEVRNIMHGAEATRAAQTMTNAMQRNASGSHPANMASDLAQFSFNAPIQPIQPGVTTPIFPGLSRNASRAATPDITSRSASHGTNTGYSTQQSSSGQPEVYILSSPTGPRAVLIHGGTDIYTSYTTITNRPPANQPNFVYRSMGPASLDPSRVEVLFGNAAPSVAQPSSQGQQQQQQQQTPQTQQQQQQQQQQPYRPPSPLVPQQPLPQVRNDPQPAIRRRPVGAPLAPAPPAAPAGEQAMPRFNHPGNPGLAPLIAALWPHIWLIIRLVAFAWWFSYTNPSWERWLSLVFGILVILAINTGIFNGIVDNAFHPVREQLEGLLPIGDRDRQQQEQQQQQQQQQQQNQGADPVDPAQTAARLVAERRMQNGAWLRDQLRRIERAGILFLASFAPGVAERHIQQIEERERAERRAAEQARAAAAAAAAANATDGEQQGVEQNAAGAQGEQQQQQGQPQGAPEVQPQPRLIDV
jgi:hypothetical protein